MPIELERLEKPLRKLRRSLKHWPAEPSVETVHKLRTQIRRLEALLNSFMLEQQPEMRRLLKVMKPVRKAAGPCAIWTCWSPMRSPYPTPPRMVLSFA
jgi:hypothetical protein